MLDIYVDIQERPALSLVLLDIIIGVAILFLVTSSNLSMSHSMILRRIVAVHMKPHNSAKVEPSSLK